MRGVVPVLQIGTFSTQSYVGVGFCSSSSSSSFLLTPVSISVQSTGSTKLQIIGRVLDSLPGETTCGIV